MKFMSLGASFRWLNITQFLGALNDNVFKLLMINFLIAVTAGPTAGGIAGVASLLFAVPFLLFTPAAGAPGGSLQQARHCRSSRCWRSWSCWRAWLRSGPARARLALRHAFPDVFAECAVWPLQIRHHSRTGSGDAISRANGQLVMFTYLAIILGTVLGPQLAPGWRDGIFWPVWSAWSSRWWAPWPAWALVVRLQAGGPLVYPFYSGRVPPACCGSSAMTGISSWPCMGMPTSAW